MFDATPLGHEIVKTPKDFLGRLNQSDASTVGAIIGTIESLAKQHKLEQCQMAPFFAVYGIGGYVTKSGDRPDINLLVVTNAVCSDDFQSEIRPTGKNWVAETLLAIFEKEGYEVEVKKKTPSKYRKVGIGPKVKLRLNPNYEDRKPIDIAIVNHISLRHKGIRSLVEFEEFGDLDGYGKPLPKVLLFKT